MMNDYNCEQQEQHIDETTTTTATAALSSSNHKCQIVTPTIDYLNNAQILTDVLCTVPNCNEIFSNISALNLHIKKVHKLDLVLNKTENYLSTTTRTRAQRLNENCKCKYYCPANNCKYNFKIGNGARYLPTFHSLKIHFIRIHGEKMYSCSKCSRKFSIKSEMCRHEERCGQLFKCSCGCPFSTIELLIKHAQMQSHCIPPYNELLTNSSKTSTTTSNIEPVSKKKAIQLKPIDIKPHNQSSAASIIIINNIAATPSITPSTSSSTITAIPFNNLILNKTNMLTSNSFTKETANMINTKTTSTPGYNLFRLPYLESCQRSLGCQTQNINDTNKIETASQTPILNVYHTNQQIVTSNENTEVFKYYETQQTQTSDNLINDFNLNQFDASTSPLNTINDDPMLNDDQFWAEISTQTFLSAFEHNNNQQSQLINSTNIQTNFDSQIQQPIQELDQQNQINFNTISTATTTTTTTTTDSEFKNREMQTCDITLNTTFTQTSQSTLTTATTTTETDNEFDFIDTIILNSYTTSETQTNDLGVAKTSTETANNDENFIQTTSIQTQTIFNECLVDNITQTPWDFTICDDLLF